MRRFKSQSAKSVNALTDRTGPLWQKGYHDHALRAEEDIKQVARYIIANPLRARLCNRVGDYPYWFAAWL
ncbi:MAG: transposase [Nitrococcus sp.]|nr:transposase [Nitrococcus sp.]